MKTEKQAEGHQVPAQTEMPTAVTNKVTKISDSSRATDNIPQEIREAVERLDFSAALYGFHEREIMLYNGTEWEDATIDSLKQMALNAILGSTLTCIIACGSPAAIEVQVSDTIDDVDFIVGDELFDIPAAVATTLEGFDFSARVTELKNYKRKCVFGRVERFPTAKELRLMATPIIEKLFSEENQHLPALIDLVPFIENGRQILAGFLVQRTIDGAELSFMYVGATGDDVPDEVMSQEV